MEKNLIEFNTHQIFDKILDDFNSIGFEPKANFAYI